MLPLTELGHGRQGQPNEMGGVKWASSLCVRMEGHWSTTSMWNAPTYREVPTPIMEGGLHTLQSSQAETTEDEVLLFKRKRGVHRGTYRPLKIPHFLFTLTIYTDNCYTFFKLIKTVVHTRKLPY